ncbi:M17 family metallopeptidase [Bacteroidota bacterium]
MKTNIKINNIGKVDVDYSILYLISDKKELENISLSENEMSYLDKSLKDDKTSLITINRYDYYLFIHFVKKQDNKYRYHEEFRRAGEIFHTEIKKLRLENIMLHDTFDCAKDALAYTEGFLLGGYEFTKYKTEEDTKGVEEINLDIASKNIDNEMIEELKAVVKAVFFSRDLINEPNSYLNSIKLAEDIKDLLETAGVKVDIFNKKKIESLKMGGLLAVNKGSIDPPTFTILEWKPENAVNTKPYVLVGKGIVYDTGGMNIKTGNYMEGMKSDMSGAAMMASVVYAIARNKLAVNVIGLIPSTDNRLDGNAYVSGDVIKMHSGLTVEVINTDAEGRLILADAISYAKKYDPELIIDSATLTGAAARAIGKYGIVAMEKDAEMEMKDLKESGEEVYERIAEFPFWEEYDELIKSDIADIKNIGGVEAGMITAGKFLARFTDYPFIHLDIAGTSLLDKKDYYRPAGGTGTGVRLLYDFFKRKSNA